MPQTLVHWEYCIPSRCAGEGAADRPSRLPQGAAYLGRPRGFVALGAPPARADLWRPDTSAVYHRSRRSRASCGISAKVGSREEGMEARQAIEKINAEFSE